MADQLPIPQNGANSTDTPSGTTGDAQNPTTKDGKKRLVKGNAVLEFIANTIQSKMTEFGLLLKEKAHGINKARATFTDLINNSDHVIMQNKITTPDSIRGWIVEGKVLGIAEQANRKTAAAAGRGNNDPPVPPHISAWCDLMDCYEEHEKFLKAGGKGVSARYSKPPPHLAGVALEKTEHAGIERKDEADDARKTAMKSIKEKKSGTKREHAEISDGAASSRALKPYLYPNSKAGF